MERDKNGPGLPYLLLIFLLALFLGVVSAEARSVLYYEEGVSTIVDEPVDDVARRAEEVLNEFDVEITEHGEARGGSTQAWVGRYAGREVRVNLQETPDDRVQVRVHVRHGEGTWDRVSAREILVRIVAWHEPFVESET